MAKLTKQEIAKFESLSKWIKEKLYPHVIDPETVVTWDYEDPGFLNIEFYIDEKSWNISFITETRTCYYIASSYDCSDVSISDIKEDIKDRIKVMKTINW